MLGRSAEPDQVTPEAETVMVLPQGHASTRLCRPGRADHRDFAECRSQIGTVTMKVALPDSREAFPLGAPVARMVSFSARDVIVLPWTALTSSVESPAESARIDTRGRAFPHLTPQPKHGAIHRPG